MYLDARPRCRTLRSVPAQIVVMAIRRGHSTPVAGLLFLTACSLAALLLVSALVDLHALDLPSAFMPALVPRQASRRQVLSALATVTPPVLLPAWSADAMEDSIPDEQPRLALYRGKAASLRSAAEWYRFFVGDLIMTGSGATAVDGLKSTDADCGGGLCSAAQALQRVQRLLPRRGTMALSQVEVSLVTPMTTMADMAVWDPDTSDVAKDQVKDFRDKVLDLADSIGRKNDGDEAQLLYTQSLQQLNLFFRTANEAAGVTPEDERYLPQLPLSQAEEENDEYWRGERTSYVIASNPVTQFQERQAFGSKEVRKGLKRFPGATLLLR